MRRLGCAWLVVATCGLAACSGRSDIPGGRDTDLTDPTDPMDWPPGLTFTEVGIDEVTPNTVRVHWWPTGVPQAFQRYEIWIGTDSASVEANVAPATMWGPDDDVNLGFLIQEAAQVVNHTRVMGLAAGTDYFVLLQAVANGSVVAHAPLMTTTTPTAPANAIDIYRDTWTAGWSIDADWAASDSSTENPYRGSESIRIQVGLPPAHHDNAGFPFHYAGLNIALAGLDDTVTEAAYLELAIDCAGGAIDYGELHLSGAAGGIWYDYPSYFVCGPGYRLLQIPLSAFDIAYVDALGGTLTQFWIYGGWQVGNVYIDEVRILYP